MIDRRRFLGSAAMGVLAAPFVARSSFAQSAEFTLKLHHLLGPNAPAQTQMLQPWADRVKEASGGRIQIDLYPSMSLGGTPPS